MRYLGLEKAVWSLVIAIAPLVGCTSTHINEISKDELFQQKGLIKAEDISVTHKPDYDSISVEELLDTSEDYNRYIDFRKKYLPYGQQIMSALEQRDFDVADAAVIELAGILEEDNTPYAQQYLEKVRNFSYVIYKVSDVVEETETTSVDAVRAPGSFVHCLVLPFVAAVDTLFIPLWAAADIELYESTNVVLYKCVKGGIDKEKEEEMLGQEVDKIQINPYAGERTILGINIPFSEIKQEIQGLQVNVNASN